MGLYRRLFKTKGGRRVLMGAAALLLLNEVAFYLLPTAEFVPACHGSNQEAPSNYGELEGPFTQHFLDNFEQTLIEEEWFYVRWENSFYITRDRYHYSDHYGRTFPPVRYLPGYVDHKLRAGLTERAAAKAIQPILHEEEFLAWYLNTGRSLSCKTVRRVALPDGDFAQRIEAIHAAQTVD